MGFAELLLIAISLSMDAFAVAVCKGLNMSKINYKHGVIIALFFGAFQALMPLIGWAAGSLFPLICHPVSMRSTNALKPSSSIFASVMLNTEAGLRLSFFKPGD